MSDTTTTVLEVLEVSKRLGRVQAVDRVSLTCNAGEVTILTGENGAGKSTLLALIAGVMHPDRGVIEIRGDRLTRHPRRARLGLGYVPEAANPPGHMTGRELFALVERLKRAEPLPDRVREALSVEPIADRRIERLSLGERRRVCLAAALIGDPTLLVLDEPTNGLDVDGIATLVAILDGVREQGAAVLIATHDRAFADRVADRRAHLSDGRLANGRLADGRLAHGQLADGRVD